MAVMHEQSARSAIDDLDGFQRTYSTWAILASAAAWRSAGPAQGLQVASTALIYVLVVAGRKLSAAERCGMHYDAQLMRVVIDV